jgi:hypothetical protein
VPPRKKAAKKTGRRTTKKAAKKTAKKKAAKSKVAKKKTAKKPAKKKASKKRPAKKKAAKKKPAKKKPAKKKVSKKRPAKKKPAKKAAKKPAGRRPAKKTAKKPAGRKLAKTAAQKKAARKKRRRRKGRFVRRKPARLKSVSLGDAVRIPAATRTPVSRYGPALARAPEAIEGVVVSIRNIATGKLVSKTRGDVSGYLLEVVHSETFAQRSSDRNISGPRTAGRPGVSPAQAQLSQTLRELAAAGELPSAAAGDLSRDPFRSLLSGWRVVKVKAERIEAAQ